MEMYFIIINNSAPQEKPQMASLWKCIVIGKASNGITMEMYRHRKSLTTLHPWHIPITVYEATKFDMCKQALHPIF